MAYTVNDYKSKKSLMEDYWNGETIPVFQPGPFGPNVQDGRTGLEGPHFPAPHSWYADVEVKDGVITRFYGEKRRRTPLEVTLS